MALLVFGWAGRQLPGRAMYPDEWLTDNVTPSLPELSSLCENWYSVEAQIPSFPATVSCGLCIRGRIHNGVCREAPRAKRTAPQERFLKAICNIALAFKIFFSPLLLLFLNPSLHWSHVGKGQMSQSRALLLSYLSLWHLNTILCLQWSPSRLSFQELEFFNCMHWKMVNLNSLGRVCGFPLKAPAGRPEVRNGLGVGQA